MFDQFVAAARTPGERIRAHARVENAACAARLNSMYDLLDAVYAESGSADRDDWRCDNWAAVCARIGAAQTITSGLANGLLTNAVVMRDKLPKVGAVFAAGLISYLLVRTICKLTALVKDPDALRALDADLARELLGWGAKSVDQIDRDINTIIARHDPYAVRRDEEIVRTAHVRVHTDKGSGVAYVEATVEATDGMAFEQRVDLLARTVCSRDSRTMEQRRAAAVGAMGFGWDRVPCLCEQPDCDAAAIPPVGGVIIHVIAPPDTLDHGHTDPPPPPADPGPDVEPPPEDTDDVDGDDWNEGEGESDDESAETDDAATPQPDTDSDHEPMPPEPEPEPERDAPEPAFVGDLEVQRRALMGVSPPLLSKPLAEYTLAELIAEVSNDPREFCPARPGAILGGPVLPGPVIAKLAMTAAIRPLIHPGQSPPEPRYRPSRALAAFVRARDMTCRFPGCCRPVTRCQIDHVIPYPYGPTAAANLACLCTEHHLLKTFWPGWSYTLDPDGTAHWTDPDGHTTTSQPGSRLLFPELSTPTARSVTIDRPPSKHTAGLRMPRRRTTRAQDRARRIDDERQRNIDDAQQRERESIPPPF